METALTPFVLFGNNYNNPDPDVFAARPAWPVVYTLWHQFDGLCRVEKDGCRWEVRPDDVAMTEPGCRVTISTGLRMRLICFALVPHGLDLCPSGIGYDMEPGCQLQPGWQELFGIPFTPFLSDTREAKQSIASIGASFWRGSLGRLEANARLYQWILHELRLRSAETEPQHDGTLVGQVGYLMDADIRRASVAALARRLHVSPQHLRACYKKATGGQLSHEIRRRRLEQAKKLMCWFPETSIGEIANNTGYQSASAFSQAFREVYGQTPREWRRQQG